MGAQGQSTLRSPRWAEQGQLLPVWRSKRKSHSYGHYSRFTLNRLYFLVTSWSLLCSGSIVQLAKCEFLFLIKSESWKSFLETICCQLGLIDVLGYWCQLDYASWLQAPRFLFFFNWIFNSILKRYFQLLSIHMRLMLNGIQLVVMLWPMFLTGFDRMIMNTKSGHSLGVVFVRRTRFVNQKKI